MIQRDTGKAIMAIAGVYIANTCAVLVIQSRALGTRLLHMLREAAKGRQGIPSIDRLMQMLQVGRNTRNRGAHSLLSLKLCRRKNRLQ